jgi:predicted transcriptional regulator
MSQKLGGTPSVLASVTEIVSAHLSNNAVPVADVPSFIRSVHATLTELELAAGGATPTGLFQLADVQRGMIEVARPTDRRPAVPIEDSIQPGYIVCLEDGKRLRMLKRYLMTHFKLTPEDYRARWNLPADYPMAAPEVVEQRREHAKTAGLGRKRSTGRRPN